MPSLSRSWGGVRNVAQRSQAMLILRVWTYTLRTEGVECESQEEPLKVSSTDLVFLFSDTFGEHPYLFYPPTWLASLLLQSVPVPAQLQEDPL